MAEGKMLDIAHISFLDMIKVMITMSGAAAAKGSLIRNAINTADKIKEVEYSSFDDFLAAIEDSTNPIAQVEGEATHQGEYVFGLAACPFAPSIGNYTEVFEKLPDGYADFTTEFNKPSKVTDNYRVGEGAGVSPFCSVHQPMRSAIAERIKIGGKKIKIYQLGCKAGSGKRSWSSMAIPRAELPPPAG
ncbi:MAG: hypothetical protein LC633_01380 [Desulfobulbaceae bacterium]|nr:hypothetical protein [Desulfobulbaceae bacterium]